MKANRLLFFNVFSDNMHKFDEIPVRKNGIRRKSHRERQWLEEVKSSADVMFIPVQ